MTNAEIAWAAGVFEGEGSIINTNRPRKQRRLAIQMTDVDILHRVAAILGGCVKGPFVRKGCKPIWLWRASRWKDIERALKAMLPWLGKRRTIAARALLADPAGPVGGRLKSVCKNGHPRTGPKAEIYVHRKTGTRHCRACHREQQQRERATQCNPV